MESDTLKSHKKLNILMVTPRYYPYVGGVETHVSEVGRRLAQHGHTITILSTTPAHATMPVPHEEESQGMRLLRVNAWPRTRDWYFAPQIRAIIKREKWDLIHCQGCHTFVPPLAMLAAREAHIPYVVTFHTGGHSSPLRNKIRGLQWKSLRPLFAQATALVGVSHFEAEYFHTSLRLPWEKFVIIPNGSALPDVPHASALPAGRTLVVSVGRLERYKGHQRSIAALPALRRWRPDVRLLILGAGPYERELRKQAEQLGVAECVEIRAIPGDRREEMVGILSQASVVALLSEYEAHPIAVMEALSLHRPVLVTETSGLKELADQGLARAISLQSSPEEVARAIQQQIEEPVLPSASFALPTWEDCANQIQNVYYTAIGRSVCAS